MTNFKQSILNGIPDILPKRRQRNKDISHAPNRKDILNKQEKKLAIINALRYFPKYMHNELAPEFLQELKQYGRIYMYRFMPNYKIQSRNTNQQIRRVDFLRNFYVFF